MFKSITCVVGWINVDALHLPLIKRKQRPKCNEVVPLNQQIVTIRSTVMLLLFQQMKSNDLY